MLKDVNVSFVNRGFLVFGFESDYEKPFQTVAGNLLVGLWHV